MGKSFNFDTRREFEKAKLREWEKANHSRISKISEEQRKVISQEGRLLTIECNRKINEYILQNDDKNLKMSTLIKDCLGEVVDVFVPEKYLGDYYSIIDKLKNFQYRSYDFDRRSVRSSRVRFHYNIAVDLIENYRNIGIYGVSVADYLLGRNLDEEALDYIKANLGSISIRKFEYILAASINANDNAVISAIREAILSEVNNVVLNNNIIEAVAKSSNSELHELLGKLLVAARLSEGLRQSICENADCGTPECFIVILDTIKRENLIRYSSVKRAIATWCGIGDPQNMDRLMDKVLDEMVLAIHDKEYSKELTNTNDSVKIIIGLWALGFYNIEDAIEHARGMVENGTRPQILAVSYFNWCIKDYGLSNILPMIAFEKYSNDLEVIAAFMPTFMHDADYVLSRCIKSLSNNYSYRNFDEEYICEPLNYRIYFSSEEKARKIYATLRNLSDSMTTRRIEFDNCVFPWHKAYLTKGNFAIRMAIIAYALSDEDLINEVVQRLSDIEGSFGPRRTIIQVLLHEPKNEIQRKALFEAVADKSDYPRQAAFGIVKRLDITKEEYSNLEDFLKLKNEDIRRNVIFLLKKQNDTDLSLCVERLLGNKKDIIRLAGFDIVKTTIEENPEKKAIFDKALNKLDESKLTETEKVLYKEIIGSDKNNDASPEYGYGLYTEETNYVVPRRDADIKKIKKYFNASKRDIQRVFDSLRDLFEEHGHREYEVHNGMKFLLKNGLRQTNYMPGLKLHEQYPFLELWEEFYEKHIKNEQFFWNVYMALTVGYSKSSIEEYSLYKKAMDKVFDYSAADFNLEYSIGDVKFSIKRIERVLDIIKSLKGFKLPIDIAREFAFYAAGLEDKYKWYTEIVPVGINGQKPSREPEVRFFTSAGVFGNVINRLLKFENDEEFKENFEILRMLDEAYKYQKKTTRTNFTSDAICFNNLTMLHFIKACELGIINEDIVYKYALAELGATVASEQVFIFNDKLYTYQIQRLSRFMECDPVKNTYDKECAFFKLGLKVRDAISNVAMSVELKRGDSETEFSAAVLKARAVYGIDNLVNILVALGKETLDRNVYYYYARGCGKKTCLSHLLHICYPLETDTVEYFAKRIKEKNISEDRIIEVAMYSPQWLDIIEQYLNHDGFKSACYYFMAHMNERFDEKRQAMIAKFTPLTSDELNDGAFDINWFKEAYNRVGEAMFQKLYKAAKYISDGNKHSRARKYADAATGAVTRDELETLINEKRNQDLLMSYGIVPISDEKDVLHRYEFIQKFKKGSKQFGSQKRASEAKASDMSLKNLATVAGYADSFRLILAMETALVKNNQEFFDGVSVDGYVFKVNVVADGKAELAIEKDGKKIKSVPAALKKNEKVLAIKEFVTKLKDQYSRSVKMFENSMEEKENYTVGELDKLCINPVIAAILNNLVFIMDDNELGLLEEFKGQDNKLIRVAHPFDLYKSGNWSKWQEVFFSKAKEGTKQPFKQVFRELYLKLDEEKNQTVSRMFAGNQIQPQRTLALLKTRKWIADYEDGLQKVYYKDNIFATFYALADWFSPADIEEPTLEYVAFYDRKTFKPVKVSDVPDIIYSEVMRDVDLVVSVAHAGGVDPETSHSTIEMRSVIVAFNIQLFKLKNVQIEGSHAIINGKHGQYSVHLGSGVTHKMGSHVLNILPVHSQNRGKIFLPFVDEDPKTAEIISKIVMLSEDQKIKDPSIMEQILR